MKDIGIDLGTANVLIYIKGEGIVLNEPSVIALDNDTKEVVAVGLDAALMVGRTPGKLKAVKPMKDGVIADFEMTEIMLEKFIKKVKGKKMFTKPRILICCPSNITQVEKNAIKEVAERTGAKKVFLEEEAKIAAIGAGLDISKPNANMVIDMGGGTTDIAILSLNGIVSSASIKVAGTVFDQDIIKYIKDKYKLLIGQQTAEKIKKQIGSAFKPDEKVKMTVKGRDLITGLPHIITINAKEVYEAIKDDVEKIVKCTKNVLETTPPELASDIVDKGIVLTGGSSLIEGLAEYFEQELNVPIFLAEDPLTCVASGCGVLLDNLKLLEK